MSAVLIENELDLRPAIGTASGAAHELGIWLSGLDSFRATAVNTGARGDSEMQLVRVVLERISLGCARALNGQPASDRVSVAEGITTVDIADLFEVIRGILILSDGLNAPSKSWLDLMLDRLNESPATAKLIDLAESVGQKNLPAPLLKLVEADTRLPEDMAELALVLPRFGVVLRWLEVVGEMLKKDEPLKPTLLIFSRVSEQVSELIAYLNGRLERFPDEQSELFASLDAAAYTTSIELKKVYSHELAGVTAMRSATSIYARMETAHSILSEGFQQMLAGFARLVDPQTDIFALFPNFREKREQSITLRRELLALSELVRSAEKDPSREKLAATKKALLDFTRGHIRYLFYKDTETLERFVEEIIVSKENKDLIPILHRFGAYLDTLAGQVSFRMVLAESEKSI